MKTLIFALSIMMTASQALAHGGAQNVPHVHPHGFDSFALLTLAFLAGIGAAVAWMRIKK